MECKIKVCGGSHECNKDKNHEGTHYCPICKGERNAS